MVRLTWKFDDRHIVASINLKDFYILPNSAGIFFHRIFCAFDYFKPVKQTLEIWSRGERQYCYIDFSFDSLNEL